MDPASLQAAMEQAGFAALARVVPYIQRMRPLGSRYLLGFAAHKQHCKRHEDKLSPLHFFKTRESVLSRSVTASVSATHVPALMFCRGKITVFF